MPKVAFKTLGCRLNQAETDQMAEDLMAIGFDVVDEDAPPDVVVVNTCTVTSEATRGSRHSSVKAVSTNPGALVVVAGCYPAAEPQEAAEIPGVGLVIDNDGKDSLAKLVASRLGIREKPREPSTLGVPRKLSVTGRKRINLKVQTGCDEWCTFCIIPRTRGPLRSLPLEDVLGQARQKVDEGARELVLTGVHLGKYGWDEGRPDDDLLALLEGLLAIEGLTRIRLSSILSKHLTPRVVALIAREHRICRFLHVPLQAGSDDVLERMNRPYRIDDYLEAIGRAKDEIDGLSLSTDVIVGFPGETSDQFSRTMEVCERVGYMKLHVFRYSPRPGTPSASWPDQVPGLEKKARSKELIALGRSIRLDFNRSHVGYRREVLVEGQMNSGDLVGHTDDFLRITFPGPPHLIDRLA
ncbi:MAG TPA: tRNA (N(6)-L-threonylcarbamoyladenosine(37)-C(2))-methylthiotransferase MtaB, partial [Actinomycetota bacterium]|nr:tRNA (N(6)-L-threonylcarbamoyladenosine(37)-C(2))-methylthiotransferase MtaB [Actinomycetota bacterium]